MHRIEHTWVVRRSHATVHVSAEHPTHGMLHCGTITATGVGDLAGRMSWRLVDPDHVWLPVVVGDFLDAEAALLAATGAFDE